MDAKMSAEEGVPPQPPATRNPMDDSSDDDEQPEPNAAVAEFVAAAGLEPALGPLLSEAMGAFGTAPADMVAQLTAMAAEAFEALVTSVKAGAGQLPSTQAMVLEIFTSIDEDKDERLNFLECASLATRTGGAMDRGTYDGVAEMVGADAESGLTLQHLEDVYIKHRMGNVAKDWSAITGTPLPAPVTPEPAPEPAAEQPASAQLHARDPTTFQRAEATRVWLLGELRRLQAVPFSWEDAGHTAQLGRVWASATPPTESITATERM